MKSIKLAVLTIALVGLFGVGNAFAAGQATINVSAEVLGTCSFTTSTYDMAFGQIDPTQTGPVTASVDLAFKCTKDTAWTLDDESLTTAGTKTMTDGGANTLDYSIDSYTLDGTGDGTEQTVTVTGRILETDYATAVAGNYTDSFTIDINP
jgi:hypothetical protein